MEYREAKNLGKVRPPLRRTKRIPISSNRTFLAAHEKRSIIEPTKRIHEQMEAVLLTHISTDNSENRFLACSAPLQYRRRPSSTAATIDPATSAKGE